MALLPGFFLPRVALSFISRGLLRERLEDGYTWRMEEGTSTIFPFGDGESQYIFGY